MALVTEMIDIGLEGQVLEDLGGLSAHEVRQLRGEPLDRGLADYGPILRWLEKNWWGSTVGDVHVRWAEAAFEDRGKNLSFQHQVVEALVGHIWMVSCLRQQ